LKPTGLLSQDSSPVFSFQFHPDYFFDFHIAHSLQFYYNFIVHKPRRYAGNALLPRPPRMMEA